MAGNVNKPEIRFTGFTDAWEQSKLGELSDVYDGTHQTPNYTDSGVMFLSVENIKTLQSEKFISEEAFEKEFKIFPEKGDVLMTRIGDIGTANVVESNEPKAYYVSLALLKHKKLDPYFLKENISSKTVKKELWHRTLHIAFPKKINKNEIANITIPYPKSEEEQHQIGRFFKSLDHLITIEQRKYNKLVIVKKSLLQKMFPKDGANVPEIRFAGFTDVWEQRKLSAYLDTSSEKNSNGDYYKSDVLSVSGEFGIVNQIEFQGRSFAGVSVSKYGIVDNGDIVYTKSPLKANPYGIIKTNKGKPGIVSTLYAVYKPKENTNPHFVQCYFESDYRLNKYLKPLVNKGAKNDMKVSDDNALTGLVIFPSYEEQTRIAEFLECLDNLITLHQRELEKLKNVKKSLLEKMFV